MVLPVYAYGQPVLTRKANEIDSDYDQLEKLISDMWETMYHAQGVGLAAPQIGRGIRLFLVDTEQVMDEGKESEGIKRVFINATILEESGKEWDYEEGCLSIPHIRGDVSRQESVTIRYVDENFTEKTETFDGINARVVQHEYDHIEGKLFTDKLKPLKKKLISRKLEQIRKGKIKADYTLRYASLR